MSNNIILNIQRLSKIYKNSNLADEEIQKEYYKYLRNYNQNSLDKAIDEMIETFIPTSSRSCPTIAEIKIMYDKHHKKIIFNDYSNLKDCKYCDNKGFMQYYKDNYEYIAYCDKCARGEQYKYDGRNNKERPSLYFTVSISEVVPIEFLENNKENSINPMAINKQVSILSNKFSL